MKNVVVNKIAKYIFTEDMLEGHWKQDHKGEEKDLSPKELMELSKEMLTKLSHSELEEYMLESPWRTDSDITGKMIADDDSDPIMHLEVIDTSEKGDPSSTMVIDRMHMYECESCGFQFYVEELKESDSDLNCPVDGGNIKSTQRNIKAVDKNKKT